MLQFISVKSCTCPVRERVKSLIYSFDKSLWPCSLLCEAALMPYSRHASQSLINVHVTLRIAIPVGMISPTWWKEQQCQQSARKMASKPPSLTGYSYMKFTMNTNRFISTNLKAAIPSLFVKAPLLNFSFCVILHVLSVSLPAARRLLPWEESKRQLRKRTFS